MRTSMFILVFAFGTVLSTAQSPPVYHLISDFEGVNAEREPYWDPYEYTQALEDLTGTWTYEDVLFKTGAFGKLMSLDHTAYFNYTSALYNRPEVTNGYTVILARLQINKKLFDRNFVINIIDKMVNGQAAGTRVELSLTTWHLAPSTKHQAPST